MKQWLCGKIGVGSLAETTFIEGGSLVVRLLKGAYVAYTLPWLLSFGTLFTSNGKAPGLLFDHVEDSLCGRSWGQGRGPWSDQFHSIAYTLSTLPYTCSAVTSHESSQSISSHQTC